MKISKLFHWLYAFLMFLPVLAVGGTCLYAIFNENAKDSYYGEVINDETFINNDLSIINNNEVIYLNTQNYSNIDTSFDLYTNSFELVDNGSLPSSAISNFSDKIRIYCRANNTCEFYRINLDNTYTWINNSSSFVCKFKINNKQGTINNPTGFYTVEYNSDSFISNAFYYSIDYIRESSLFGWADNTFLVVPFTYIGTVLGVPNGSVIYLFLGYWLSISLAWLVFDLIMYVPLLVHRWIDKGVLE